LSGVASELYDEPFLLLKCVGKHHIGFCLLSQQPRRNFTERFIFFLQFGVLFPELFNRIFSYQLDGITYRRVPLGSRLRTPTTLCG
jgi:hypothetical protein